MNLSPEEKIARKKLEVLELADALGNVSEACRRRGVSRTTFYEYKERFEEDGLEGLKDREPIPDSHPMATPEKHVERMLEMSREHPAWGCDRLSAQLKLEGISISGPTIQKYLNEHGRGSRYERWLLLEQERAEESIELTDDQIEFLEEQNPQFKERHVESDRPGELLCQDTFFVGKIKGIGKVHLHAVVDTYSSFAFGFLHTAKTADAAATALHNEVLPLYEKLDIEVESILTDNGTEFCGGEEHSYELYLELNDIEHRTTKVGRPQTNGFVERFNRTFQDEFLKKVGRTQLYESLDALQADVDKWLHHYNYERPHLGYRNMGNRPFETINEYLSTVGKEA